MADKLSIISSAGTYQTLKDPAHSGARTKGAPEIYKNILMFPFDDYDDGDDHLLVFKAERVEAYATAVNTVLAQVAFVLGDKLYWDASASKITNVAAGNRLIGRCLKANDLSAAVPAGSTLEFELNPEINFRIAYGTGTLDGSNPTSITHGLGTCLSFIAQLIGTSAPGDNTSVLTANINGAAVDVYAWKNTSGSDPTLVASTGTETFYWIAVGL